MINEDNIIKFVDLFCDDEVDVRYNAVIELIKIGKPSIPYLLAALDHENWLVRYNSVRRAMHNWSHFKFKNILKSKAELLSSIVIK